MRIEAIAMTLRNAVKFGRGHARVAFALVGAELEASSGEALDGRRRG